MTTLIKSGGRVAMFELDQSSSLASRPAISLQPVTLQTIKHKTHDYDGDRFRCFLWII